MGKTDAKGDARGDATGRRRGPGRPFTKEYNPSKEASQKRQETKGKRPRRKAQILREMRAVVAAEVRPKVETLTPFQRKLWELYQADFPLFMDRLTRLEQAREQLRAKRQEKVQAGPDVGTAKALAILEEWLANWRAGTAGSGPSPGPGGSAGPASPTRVSG